MKEINFDPKVNYIIKTLSRTKRKDYENYVINAIWNRIDKKIKPISQQYVKNPNNNGHHYFIDLYFPSINVGIECDEAYHLGQKDKDAEREITIYDELHKLNLSSDYKPIHIDMSVDFNSIESQINDAVSKINEYSQNISLDDEWSFLSPEIYFAHKDCISVRDNISFQTHEEINRIIFNSDYKLQSGGYALPIFHSNPQFKNHTVWYPQLVIKQPNGEEIGRKGWYNKLLSDGNIIEEFNLSKISEHPSFERKIVFAKDKDILGNNGYKFIGIFKPLEMKHEASGTTWIYEKVSDKCLIIK